MVSWRVNITRHSLKDRKSNTPIEQTIPLNWCKESNPSMEEGNSPLNGRSETNHLTGERRPALSIENGRPNYLKEDVPPP